MKNILNDFDPNKNAVINPTDLVRRREDMPKIAVTCFSRATFDRMLDAFGGQKVTIRSLANLDITVYETLYKDAKVALFLSPVGAPACALLLEDIFALGVEKVVMFGTCGVLDKSIEDCSIIIPTGAVRDEGTSYGRLAPDRHGIAEIKVPFTVIQENSHRKYSCSRRTVERHYQIKATGSA